jgi:hypothetical protein
VVRTSGVTNSALHITSSNVWIYTGSTASDILSRVSTRYRNLKYKTRKAILCKQQICINKVAQKRAARDRPNINVSRGVSTENSKSIDV